MRDLSARQFTLSPAVRYRRESFGGVLYHKKDRFTKYYNHAGALLIEALVAPKDEAEILQIASDHGVDPHIAKEFFRSLVSDDVICQVNGPVHKRRQLFFTEVDDFFDDRFYSPLGVELELTLKCMRRCAYCAYGSHPGIGTEGQLSRASYADLFSSLNDLGVFFLRFTGGDPLTRTDCLDIIADADTYDFALTLASDLTVFRPDFAVKLGSIRNLVALQTTLDGHKASLADEFRGKGSFRRTTEALEELRAHDVPIIVGTVITQRNFAHVYEIAEFLSQWQVAYCVSPLYAAGRGRDMIDLIPTDDQLGTAYEQFGQAVQKGLVTPADPGWRGVESLPNSERRMLWSGQPWLVRSPDQLLRIDPTGQCYTSIHLKEKIGDSVYVGNVQSANILDLWHHAPLFRQMRRSASKNRYYGDVFDIRKFAANIEGGVSTTFSNGG